jgi:hypothetical protein
MPARQIEAEIKELTDEISQAETHKNDTRLLVEAAEKRLSQLREQADQSGELSRRLERIRSAAAIQGEIEQHEATLVKARDLTAEADRIHVMRGPGLSRRL